MKKRILSILLVIALASSLVMVPAYAENDAAPAKDGTEYTTVFVHGLLGFGYNDKVSDLVCYWGMTSGNMMDYLGGKGYDVVNASVGPLSSCWDRCCELFAQLTGTKTDYGAAHSKACEESFANADNDLKHDRYGRDYTGAAITSGWGPIYDANGKVTGWYDNKLNLVGHSFGGPTVTMFLQLLAEGDADEIAWGKEQAALYGGDWHDYVSPLFWGDYDGEYLINSVTSLAGVLNGTTFLSTCKNSADAIMSIVAVIANSFGLTDLTIMYDFQLEHFGITKTPGEAKSSEEYFSFLKQQGFLDGYDNALFDLSIMGTNDLKQGWDTYDNVYYFSYAGDKTYEDPLTGYHNPDPDIMPLFSAWSFDMGHDDYSFEQVKDIHGKWAGNTDKSWMANDGMVNTISARYPIGAANKPYDKNAIEPGIWQWSDKDYDHLSFCGGLLDPRVSSTPKETRAFYQEIMDNIAATTPIAKPANPDPDPTPEKPFPFKDVPKGGWSYDYINKLYQEGIVNGKTSDTFDPKGNVTRGQFVKMLGCLDGIDASQYSSCRFGDVSNRSVFAPYIEWAAQNGIVNGYDAQTFKPSQNISREQMAAIICRYCEYAGIELPKVNPATEFGDEASISAYAIGYVKTLQEAGIICGYEDGNYRPFANTTREQACKVLCGLL